MSGMIIMMQKEVADRITASPGYKSIWFIINCHSILYGCRSGMIVPKTVFMPQPNVESAVLRLTRKATPPAEVIDEDFLFRSFTGVLLFNDAKRF